MYKEKRSPAWTLRAVLMSNAVFCVCLSSHLSTHCCLAGYSGSVFFAPPTGLSALLSPAEREVAYAQAC
ncbi:hypothetical protein [Propionispora hippei]|uniref:Secreted protein n=1 Tax=Propionispora hippei DSM 15287 TaxID=1123003 RepID=A0A1M6IU56_9FIRM|nr:hypothetical protein [Propionispora hippei]SHJ37955.1 hypothetical protein SAMN02745170_02404 [Propionispora hippei DSM 15287]